MRIFQNSIRKFYLVILFFLAVFLLVGINMMKGITQNYDHRENIYSETSELTPIQYKLDYSTLYGQKLDEMKLAYQKLNETQLYYEIWDQFLYIENCTFGEKFLYCYEEGYSDSSIYMLETEEGVTPLHAIKTMQLSENCMNLFQIDVLKGRTLDKSDMDYADGSTIPVLIGSEYIGILNVGDVFHGSYILKEFDFEVVGILKSGSNITVSKNPSYLDRYIIMPFLNFNPASNPDDDTFQVRHYSSKLTGSVPFDAMQSISAQLITINSLGIGTLSIAGEAPLEGMYTQIIQTVGLSTHSLKVLLTIVALILCPVLFFVFLRSNFDLYGTMFMLGFPMQKLRLYIWLQFIVLIMAALGSVWIYGLFSHTSFYLQTIVTGLVMILIVGCQLLFLSAKSIILWMGSGKHVKIRSYF